MAQRNRPPLLDVVAIRLILDEHRQLRNRALFDLALGSKLRSFNIVKMKIDDIEAGGAIRVGRPATC